MRAVYAALQSDGHLCRSSLGGVWMVMMQEEWHLNTKARVDRSLGIQDEAPLKVTVEGYRGYIQELCVPPAIQH